MESLSTYECSIFSWHPPWHPPLSAPAQSLFRCDSVERLIIVKHVQHFTTAGWHFIFIVRFVRHTLSAIDSSTVAALLFNAAFNILICYNHAIWKWTIEEEWKKLLNEMKHQNANVKRQQNNSINMKNLFN